MIAEPGELCFEAGIIHPTFNLNDDATQECRVCLKGWLDRFLCELAERMRNQLLFLFYQIGRRANPCANPTKSLIKKSLIGRVDSADIPESIIVSKDVEKLLDGIMWRALDHNLGHYVLAHFDRERWKREYVRQLRISKKLGNPAELSADRLSLSLLLRKTQEGFGIPFSCLCSRHSSPLEPVLVRGDCYHF